MFQFDTFPEFHRQLQQTPRRAQADRFPFGRQQRLQCVGGGGHTFDHPAQRLADHLAPQLDNLVPGDAHQAMLAVGVIEIVAGLVVAVRPKFGGYLVAAWLAGIIVNLLLLGDHYDVALRDVGLLLGALALARLATAFDHRPADA